MPLKKKSISDEQEEKIRELLSKRVKLVAIVKKLRISRTTLWRNMVFLGMVKEQKKDNGNKQKGKMFSWADYKKKDKII